MPRSLFNGLHATQHRNKLSFPQSVRLSLYMKQQNGEACTFLLLFDTASEEKLLLLVFYGNRFASILLSEVKPSSW